MDTMTATKIVGAFCGALLFFLLVNMGANALYGIGGESHEAHEAAAGAEGAGHEAAEPAGTETAAAEAPAEETVDVAALIAAADPAKGEKVYKKCKSCHSTVAGENKTGPHLAGVVGRPVASVEGFRYSKALQNLGGDWTEERLFAFLEKPKAFAPGTKMSFAGLKKPEDRAALIAYLATLK